MVTSNQQLRFSLVWPGSDIQELAVYAQSEHFSGSVTLYVASDELVDLADRLSGFPVSRADQRTMVLGQASLSGYGLVKITFRCRDSTGHVGVYVEMQCAPSEPMDKAESCAVLLQVVPSDIDRFVKELLALKEEGQVATLLNAA